MMPVHTSGAHRRALPPANPSDDDIDILGSSEDTENPGIDIVNDIVTFRKHPLQFLETIRKHYIGTSWRSYDRYIGARLYYPEWREHILQDTLSRPVLQNCISDLVNRRMAQEMNWDLNTAEREARRVQFTESLDMMARHIADESMPVFASKGLTKFLYYTVAQIFARCYHQGVHIPRDDIRRVRAQAKELEKKKQSLILFPCHKSHFDYISLVFAFFRLNLSLPVTVAGDNLNVAVVGPMLREVGALYIRRTNWSQDPLYGAFFQALVDSLLREGVNLQCFVEGTRSRTGKLLPPKFGILKYILETILSGSVTDAWVLPISTQYDKVVEGDVYATELLGKEKKRESFLSLLESANVLSLRLGRVDIRFGEMWSLRNFVIEHLQLESTVSFPVDRPITDKTRIYLLRSLGYRILADINHASAIMPSALVGTVLLTTNERGISRKQLITRVSWLIDRVIEAGGHVGALTKKASDLQETDVAALVDNAISVLGPELVSSESKRLLEPVYFPKDEFKLSYYRNQTVYLFISEAIVCVALYTLSKKDFKPVVRYDDLERKVKFLSVLLSGEFVYKPEGLETNLSDTLNTLVAQNVVRISPDGREVTMNIEAIQTGFPVFDFYCYLVWPYIDGYWAVTLSLFSLPTNSEIKEQQFYKMAQTIARTLYAQGELTHAESLNKELIKFAVSHFESQGIVKRVVDEEARTATLQLTSQYQPQYGPSGKVLLEGPLYVMSEALALSRNKHLRYGLTQTITDRMLKLCQPLAATLCSPRV